MREEIGHNIKYFLLFCAHYVDKTKIDIVK